MSEITVDVSHLTRWSIDQARRVQEEGTAEVIDGTLCDIQTAAAVVAVFEALTPEHKRVAETLEFARFGKFAWSHVA